MKQELSMLSGDKNHKIKHDTVMNKKTTIKSLMKRTCDTFDFTPGNEGGETAEKGRTSINFNPQNKINIDAAEPSKTALNFHIKTKKVPKKKKKNLWTDGWPPIKIFKGDRVINIPWTEEKWQIKQMMSSTFKKVQIEQEMKNPIIFNVFSNTKAAPFTSEKTQIPISHRISSFYTLSLQNFIIDKSTKNIKRIFDEYFFKYKTIKFEEPATEWEEYLALLEYGTIDQRKIKLKKETYKRYIDIIENSISDDYISEFKQEWMLNIISFAYGHYENPNYESLLKSIPDDIIRDYKTSMKTAIWDYILKHPEQREKLKIPVPFRKWKEYAEQEITRPSDGDWEWKSSWNKNKLSIANNWYIMCENITKIMKYYEKNLKMTSYLDLNEDNHTWPTSKWNNFIEKQKTKLEAQKEVINDDWRKYVENILKENKIYKDQLILYFKSVSGVMSSQWRNIVIGSVRRYSDYINTFKKPRYFLPNEILVNQFNSKFEFQKSFIEIEIRENPGKTQFIFSEDVLEIHTKLTNIVKDIIKCSISVERPDNMFIKNPEKHSNLWEIPISDSIVVEMYKDIDQIVNENLNIISKVIELYDPFVFVITEGEEIKRFIGPKEVKDNKERKKKKDFKHRFPKREDYAEKIKFYQAKEKLIEEMPNNWYMNMIKVNCTEINKYIISKIEEFINSLLKNILSTNIIEESNYINQECGEIMTKIDLPHSNPETWAKHEFFLDEWREEQLPKLYREYDDFLEWLFFYLQYDTYSVFETSQDNANSMEQNIKNAFDNLKRLEPSIAQLVTKIESSKKKYTDDWERERDDLLKRIGKWKETCIEYKEFRDNIGKLIYGDDISTLLENVIDIKQRAEESQTQLEGINKDEGYLGYPDVTEDTRIQECIDMVQPIIDYFTFIGKFNAVQKLSEEYLYQLKFEDIDNILNQGSIFDIAAQKWPKYRMKMKPKKEQFEWFKKEIELARRLFPIVEIFKIQDIEESEIYKDNRVYCLELNKYFPKQYQRTNPEEIQLIFQNLKYLDVKTLAFKELLNPYYPQMDEIWAEWKIVNEIYEEQPKMIEEVDLKFEIDRYNKKEFLIIKHDNFTMIIGKLKGTIEKCEKKLNDFKEPRSGINAIESMSMFLGQLNDMVKIIESIQIRQYTLEEWMEKMPEIKKNSQNFTNLKQAEKLFKSIIDVIKNKDSTIKITLQEKKMFDTSWENWKKLLRSIEAILAENK